jgi:ABC-type Zn uptake system ZnuABC Zn-binding protein ZnuA
LPQLPIWQRLPPKSAVTVVEVESLASGIQDPDSMPGKPSYLLKLQHANLVIVAGLEFDAGWLTGRHHAPSAISQSGKARIQPRASGHFDASVHAEILETPAQPFVRDIHPLGDPDYWLSPGGTDEE